LKNKKAQRKRDADDKTTEVEEIRKELGKINKVLVIGNNAIKVYLTVSRLFMP